MDARTITRKRRLQALIDGKPYLGNQAAFAEKAGLSKGRITQLLDPAESFGERSARSLAAALRLPDDYFDGNAEPVRKAPPTVEEVLTFSLDVLTKVLQSADKSILIAVAPLLAAMASDPRTAENQSEIILKLLVGDRDKSHKTTQDRMYQSRIFAELGLLDLGATNGRSDTDTAPAVRKK